jgi:hypothetical protein
MAFKFLRDSEIGPFAGSIVFHVGGSTATIKTRFNHYNQTAFAEWANRECASVASAAQMAAHALEVLADWSDITDESDNPLPLNLASLTDLIERHPAAYVSCVTGYVRARQTALEKN